MPQVRVLLRHFTCDRKVTNPIKVPPPPTQPAIINRAEIFEPSTDTLAQFSDQLQTQKSSLKTVENVEQCGEIVEQNHQLPEFKNHVELIDEVRLHF